MNDKKLSWDNEEDKLQTIKNLLEEIKSSQLSHGNHIIYLKNKLCYFVPWLISRVEELGKKIELQKLWIEKVKSENKNLP